MSAPKANDLAERRRQLRIKRRIKFYQRVWRSLAMIGFAGGIVWLARSPIWLLRSAEQIEVSENQTLSDANVRDLVPVAYPQTLLEIEPDELANMLTKQASIESAVVSRRLIPPGLYVRITERQPVAIALPNKARPVQTIPDQPQPFQEPGLIDAQGYWMPRNSFADVGADIALPTLTVEGMRPGYAGAWQVIYQEIQRSPVKITAIDWSDPNNLILQSELGAVHIGTFGDRFAAQLAALDQLRSLSEKVNPEQVAFIDLKDPQNPVIETFQANNQSF
ncbi:cell division protein FtsQ/DivIB [cf. Phormidesmis sp. LEGE 11477]|uniref:cell division protein FtsQ/DivIB n=1 Tax=cf. Phormidesmis sp. LEGE 11477 TaxID=1828680 RepID=UPI001882A555|nr:FtsQ-type POTRA domain-containing protein [cf. Phormidesmis sp. LEGE 11477]